MPQMRTVDMLSAATEAPLHYLVGVLLSFPIAQGTQLICGGWHGVLRTGQGCCT